MCMSMSYALSPNPNPIFENDYYGQNFSNYKKVDGGCSWAGDVSEIRQTLRTSLQAISDANISYDVWVYLRNKLEQSNRGCTGNIRANAIYRNLALYGEIAREQ